MVMFHDANNWSKTLDDSSIQSNTGIIEPWTGLDQPWPQPGRDPGRLSVGPAHSPDGGAGFDSPSNASELTSVVNPVVNWMYGSYSVSTDALGTPIADMKGQLTTEPDAEQRCGGSSLYTILIQTVSVSGSDHSFLRIIEGEDASLAWEVDLGATEIVKASPLVVDMDDDGKQEIIVVYDAAGTLHVDAWSPQLECSVTGWSSGGSHSSELLWTYTDDSLMISSTNAPYALTEAAGHLPTTQPLLADLDLDGDAELVIAAIDEVSESPVVIALPLGVNGVPTTIWESTLQDGSHPSDPAFAQIDEDTGYVLLTSTLASSGAMWVWKLDSETGDQKWGGLSLSNLDGDSDVPHIRLPGPIIAELDGTSGPEMVITIPTDADGATGVDGAEYRGLEIDDGTELWSFEAVNGFADAPPIMIDTDEDDVHDRACWVTWYQSTWDRHGLAGCHDVTTTNPQLEWYHELERSSGNLNDEIAVSQPVWMDIDGNEIPELLVAYGRTLWAWDGDTGTQAAINSDWTNEVNLEHRTWSSPAFADIDGDATLDVVLGDTVVTTELADLRPLLDGRSIEFNPSAPDPNEEVTVTAFFENAGTTEIDRDADAVLYADGVEIARHRATSLNPTGPTGNGGFESFSIEWHGSLGSHTFELILDPYQNVTQSRYDNDAQTSILNIVPPYNATFEIPTEPTRVDPGSSTVTNPTIRSTGRLAGIWSLSVDDSDLPVGWSWSDESQNGLTGIEIGIEETWSPSLRIIAPSNAPGSDAGHLELTLTLDEDQNISVSAVLPVEANRTRGLSIRGPSGTSESTGYGLIGDSAKAWLIVENLGNADENSISMYWDSTSWTSSDNDLELYDENAVLVPALTLQAGESKIMTARLSVPSSENLGSSVSTPLTMCVGMGDEETCQTIELTFVATGVIAETIHQKSMPENSLTWIVTADLPTASAAAEWSLNDAGMSIEDWMWSASGDLVLNSDTLVIQGSPGSRVSGSLHLELPVDAPPAFHSFSDSSSIGTDYSLQFSVEVLQIHRATLTLISPTESPHMVDVETATPATVKLFNPGNGDDSYSMSYSILLDSELTEDPGVQITFSSSQISLSAGSLRTLPIEIFLPETTPARTPVNIEIIMTSNGNDSISSSIIINLEARQDHRWEFVSTTYSGGNVDGHTFPILPGQSFTVDISASNIGNMQDDLDLSGTGTVSNVEGDSSNDWVIIGSNVIDVAVNETEFMTVIVTAPSEAWNGSLFEVTITGIAFDEAVYTLTFSLEVTHVASWTAEADDANLEIDPEGSTVSLTIKQQGNSPTQPYASVYVTGENGWEIVTPSDLPTLEPGQTTPLNLEITPPSTARHGRTVELHIKLREGDGTAESLITLPLRVAIIHEFSLSSSGKWILSEDGGYPLAELQNLGNAPTTISLDVLSLPQGWSISGRTEVVLGVGEITGVPVEVIPSEDWDGSSRTIRILAQDSAGNQREVSLDTKQELHSWASSPVIVAMDGDSTLLELHGATPTTEVSDDAQFTLQWDLQGGWAWLASIGGVGTQLTIDSTTILPYSAYVIEPSARTASCVISGVVSNVHSECSIGNGTSSFQYTILLIDDQGLMLDSVEGTLPAGVTLDSINLSATDWNPEPGKRTMTIRLLDNRGVLTTEDQTTFDVRRSDWNVGLIGLEIKGEGASQEIEVLTKRENQHLLSDADCTLFVTADTYTATHTIDMTEIYSPTPRLDRPDVEDGTEMVVRISCAFPWDIDSDNSDDEVRMILSGSSTTTGGGFEWITSIAFAILIITIALTLTWIVKNQRERKQLLQMTESVIRKREVKKENSEPITESTTIVNNEAEELPIPPPPTDESQPEVVEEALDEFESRLKRLSRRE